MERNDRKVREIEQKLSLKTQELNMYSQKLNTTEQTLLDSLKIKE